MTGYFDALPPLVYEGPESANAFAFRHYDPDEIVLGRRLEEHLRFAVAYWHSFAGTGADPFGGPTFARPWFGEDLDAARAKADAAFAFFEKLGQPFFCFHDLDIRPETGSLAGNRVGLEAICDHVGPLMERTGTRLLWGTANLFSHPRFMAGAATNPDPEVFAWAAATVKDCMDATHRLGGANYVLWGGREGYETLLNTDLAREQAHLGRFLAMVVEYKHKIGFGGTILLEPKPKEPSKHQYDVDVATVHGMLQRFGLEGEVKLNIETGHAFLAGHSFEHEIAQAAALGVFGSIDMNRNDWVSGWDTDQFPVDPHEVMLAYYEILRAGGFTTGGTNFDAKLRRQSIDPEDLLLAHAAAMDVCARGFKAAARAWDDGVLEAARAERYAGWSSDAAQAMLGADLATIAAEAHARDTDPKPRSGRQERLEALFARYL